MGLAERIKEERRRLDACGDIIYAKRQRENIAEILDAAERTAIAEMRIGTYQAAAGEAEAALESKANEAQEYYTLWGTASRSATTAKTDLADAELLLWAMRHSRSYPVWCPGGLLLRIGDARTLIPYGEDGQPKMPPELREAILAVKGKGK